MDDVEREGRVPETAGSDESHANPRAIIDRIQAAFADVPIEEVEAEIDRAIAGIRAEARAASERA